MKLPDSLKRLFGQLAAVSELARADRVAALVPNDAQYVTVGAIAVLADARQFNGGEPGRAAYGRDLSHVPQRDGLRQDIALRVLTRAQLLVIEASGVRWSTDIAQVTDLDGHRRSGFLVFTRATDGLAVGQPTPVEVPPGAEFRTIRGMTNLFGGWDEVLAPFGVQRHW
jgi:hypothetical protein